MAELKDLNDDDLIRLIKTNNEKAFNEIYNRYWSRLLAQATYDLQDKDDAEECVHDVFIKLWKNRANITLNHKLSTYLYRAVKNQVINTLEKRFALRNKIACLTDISDNFVPSADATIIEKELLAALEQAIDNLPDKCAIVYRLSRNGNKSNREISAQLGISEKTVEAHITRALKNISDAVISSTVTSLVLLILHNHK